MVDNLLILSMASHFHLIIHYYCHLLTAPLQLFLYFYFVEGEGNFLRIDKRQSREALSAVKKNRDEKTYLILRISIIYLFFFFFNFSPFSVISNT